MIASGFDIQGYILCGFQSSRTKGFAADLVTRHDRFPKQAPFSIFRYDPTLKLFTVVKMSSEKDKSKVHKLSLKGTVAFALQFHHSS